MYDPESVEVAGIKFEYQEESAVHPEGSEGERGNTWKSQDLLQVTIEGILYFINRILVYPGDPIDPIVIIRVPFTREGDTIMAKSGGPVPVEDFAVESVSDYEELKEMGPLCVEGVEYTQAFLKGPVWRNQDGKPVCIIINGEEYPIPDILVYRGMASRYNDNRFLIHDYTLIMKGNTIYEERHKNTFACLLKIAGMHTKRGKDWVLGLFNSKGEVNGNSNI